MKCDLIEFKKERELDIKRYRKERRLLKRKIDADLDIVRDIKNDLDV